MISRVAAVSAAVAMVILVASGCQPEPAPSPSAAAFATEAEAFAAAEETYRAYVDALNQVDLSDPDTATDVLEWTVGDANTQDRESYDRLREAAAAVTGETVLTSIKQVSATETARAWSVELAVCLDVSGVRLLDPAGKSLVDPNRPDVQSIAVKFVSSAKTPTGLAIAQTGPASEEAQC
jgi:hypothetical protein